MSYNIISPLNNSEGKYQLNNSTNQKNIESNLNLVDLCTDSCIGNYDFKLKDNQKDCLSNCYIKVNKINSYINNNMGRFI